MYHAPRFLLIPGCQKDKHEFRLPTIAEWYRQAEREQFARACIDSRARQLVAEATGGKNSATWMGSQRAMGALAHSRLRLIDHERWHLIEEFPNNSLSLFRQPSFPKSTIHQTHPSVAGSLIYGERRMTRAEARMTSSFDVRLRSSEPTDQKISEALLGTQEISRRVHRSQKIIQRDLPIEGGDQVRKTFRANHGINFVFLHLPWFSLPKGSVYKFFTKPSSVCDTS
jgi:hypothetical protein